MKAFLLAAGSGSRLRPLTDTMPKCLLPIQGVPLLQLWLQNCALAGITEVLINFCSHAEKFKEFLNGRNLPVRVRMVEEKKLLGSAGTLAENREFLEDEEAFFVLYGDVLTNVSLAEMCSFHRDKNLRATIGIYQVPDAAQCGIVTTDGQGVVTSFVEKPPYSESSWAFSGVMIADSKIVDLVPARRPADIGFHLLPRLIGQMTAYPIADYLLDIGTVANYEKAQSSWPGLGQGKIAIGN